MRKMVKKFWRKANSLLLAVAMTVTLLPAQTSYAVGADDAADAVVSRQADNADSALDLAAITGKEYTVIKGNAPVLPKKANVTSDNGTMAATQIQWADWDNGAAAGKHTVTGTVGGMQISVRVDVLPCDEEVADAKATGSTDGVREAVHPLKGYKGLFVAEYDIVPDEVKSTHDRAVIYLPEKTNDGLPFDSGNCWDNGARLQFKYGNNNVTYFQTQNGDGQDKNNAVYYPTNAALDEALANNRPVQTIPFDEVNPYRVRVVMDTVTDKTKGNYKVFITDPDGVEHEVTMPGGNGFRIYPKDGIVKNFAAVRGSYRLINHKISWISGYATKKTETYFKARNAAEYVKEGDDVVTKELPGVLKGQSAAEIVKDNQSYALDTEKSGWYNGEEKVASVTAEEGDTVTYRAYYNYARAIDKTGLNGKIQEAASLKKEDYTSGSWKTFEDALTTASQMSAAATASQAEVDEASQSLDTAKENLVSIKNLKEAVDKRKKELADKEEHKADYTNWDEVERALRNAEIILNRANATKAQVENAEKSLEITLIVKEEQPKPADKTALNQAIATAKAKKAADYKSASYRNMQSKLTAAQAVANDPNATQAEVDKAKNELADAVNKLVKAVKVKSIKRAAKSYKIAAGKKLDLKKVFSVSPQNADNKKLTYSMDKKYRNYASIKSGVVTVKKKGAGKTISVKAAAADGSGKTATIKIKIMKSAVTKITVKKKTLSVKAGKKITIKPVVTPNNKNVNKTLSYTSSNEKLATVKNGVVKTKKGKKGKVTITIRSTDGTNKSVKVKINIKK